MSDRDQLDEIDLPEDDVEIPEDTSPDEGRASQQAKRGMSPAAKFGLVIATIGAVSVAALAVGGDDAIDPTSQVRVDTKLDSTPGGKVQSDSARYQELLEAANAEAAEQARREGRTFIPTPERVLEPIDKLDELDLSRTEQGDAANRRDVAPAPTPAPAPVPQPVAVTPPPPAAAPAKPQIAQAPQRGSDASENPFTQAMLNQMGALAVRQPVNGLVITSTDRAGQEADVFGTPIEDGAETPEVAEEVVLVPAGSVLYAETLTSTNSDLTGSPVLVELTTGEFRGARLIGGFEVNQASDSMVIQFSTMTLPDGRTLEISAYAVDGFTAEAAVASDVERRYMKRYGPILAAAFITSYAEAMAEPAQTIAIVDGEATVVTEPRDMEQSLFAGVGAAAQAIGSDLVQSAPRGPKVILRDGYPLAVMFTTSATVDE